jgi:hypothetical protein
MKAFLRTILPVALACAFSTQVQATPVSFTQLAGLTGGVQSATAVYRADLSTSGLTNIFSISIQDNSSGLGGSPGQFSGFDLDAIVLSNVSCATAACAKSLVGADVFNFNSGTLFTLGTQRAPSDPKLFGTNPSGTAVDNSTATLGIFDGESTTAIPGAFGFVSMGDNGLLDFNLTSSLATSGLFLYIGEVGNNGEVAASNIEVRDVPVTVPGTGTVPEPTTWMLMGLGIAGIYTLRRKA